MPRSNDDRHRELACKDLGTTYLVEAGAGTGKTAILVQRFVAWLLHGSPIRRVAAITFTEKAAGELRFRIRERLVELLRPHDDTSGPSAVSEEERLLLLEALRDLDQAPISTIHAFAARLLHEAPLEAGVDPAFEQLDAFGSALLLEDLWQQWLALVLEDGANHALESASSALLQSVVSHVLAAGVRLDSLAELAEATFHARYDVRVEPQAPAPISLEEDVTVLAAAAADLDAFCEQSCTDPADKGLAHARQACMAIQGLQDLSAKTGLHATAAAIAALPIRKNPHGRKQNWRGGGKAELQEHFERLHEARSRALSAYGDFIAGNALAAAWNFASWAAQRQAALGKLDFTDLLGRLRNTLRDDREQRQRFQAAFDAILVDEFQDTDPLQVECLLYLCEQGAVAETWPAVRLAPGKLFLVGDPKQSIYRFRRADIGIYDEVKRLIGALGGRQLAITECFRTVPSILSWINAAFSEIIGRGAAEGRQPAYVPLHAHRGEPGGTSIDGQPRAWLLAVSPLESKQRASVRRAAEARAVAAQILQGVQGRRWTVRESAPRQDEAESMRPSAWSDVCILLRSFTGVEVYERALRAAGVPYRVEGGRAFYLRREVRDAIVGLRAVADAADPPAIYAALHSTLFGFTDEQLFLFAVAGGRFDYLTAQPEGTDSELVAALQALRGLHAGRIERGVAGTLQDLLRVTRAYQAWAAHGEGGAQAVANLEKLLHYARVFDQQDGATLQGFVRWAERASQAAEEAESVPDDEDQAVRIMTIHGAKGLEFPIVILADGVAGGRSLPSAGLRLRRREGLLECSVRSTSWPTPFATLGFAGADEDERDMEERERRRLFYVAATRAADLLLIALPDRPEGGSLIEPLTGVVPEPGEIDREQACAGLLVVPAISDEPPYRQIVPTEGPTVNETAAWWRSWAAGRERLLAVAALPAPIVSPSGLEKVEPAADDEGRPVPGGRPTALAVGSAVHRVMELISLRDPAELTALAHQSAMEQGVPHQADRIRAMARACWLSAPVREAAAASEQWREVPVSFVLGHAGARPPVLAGTSALPYGPAALDHAADSGAEFEEAVLVEGVIDLLYRSTSGYIVLDYKTDTGFEEEIERRYRYQGGAYALAVEAVVGEPVRTVHFVRAAEPLADGGAAVLSIIIDDELRAVTRRLAAAAAGPSFSGSRPGPA